MSEPLERYTLAEIREALESAERLAQRVHDLEGDEWLTHEEAAAKLGTTPATLHKVAVRDRIPRARYLRKYFYKRADLNRYLEACRLPPGS